MWVRKRIEITARDILRGLYYCAFPSERFAAAEQLRSEFSWDGQAIPFLSVRSGFDALLESLKLPHGCEILISSLTIKDMPRIVLEHGLVPVPIDLQFPSVSPDIETIRRSITPRTRAIVIAHLFGGQVDLTEVAAIARQHNLVLIEDCAQAYCGPEFVGSEHVDVSMFSFGPIKTNTALYGAMLNVASPSLRNEMLEVQRSWPVLGRLSFAQRLLKYLAVKAISIRPIAGAIAAAFRMLGSDHDGFATKLARGFVGSSFFQRIRHQPSDAVLKLLTHRLKNFEDERISRRIELAELFLACAGRDVVLLGSEMICPTFWVLPVVVRDPDSLVKECWRAGFDATRSSSLRTVEPTVDWIDNEARNVDAVMRHVVLLPFSWQMPSEAIERMAAIVKDAEPMTFEELCVQPKFTLEPVLE